MGICDCLFFFSISLVLPRCFWCFFFFFHFSEKSSCKVSGKVVTHCGWSPLPSEKREEKKKAVPRIENQRMSWELYSVSLSAFLCAFFPPPFTFQNRLLSWTFATRTIHASLGRFLNSRGVFDVWYWDLCKLCVLWAFFFSQVCVAEWGDSTSVLFNSLAKAEKQVRHDVGRGASTFDRASTSCTRRTKGTKRSMVTL